MRKKKSFIKKYVPIPAAVCIGITLISVITLVFAVNFTAVADAVNGSVSTAVRILLSLVSYVFPFSVFEILVLLAIPVSVAFVVIAFRSKDGWVRRIRRLFSLLAVIGIIYTSYIFTLTAGYHTTPLGERMGLDSDDEITEEELYSVTVLVRDKVNELCESLNFEGGESRSGYNIDQLSGLIVEAYDAVNAEYHLLTNYNSRAKPIIFSGVMTDAGITGIYSFFTGESNINMAYPDYNLPFTIAHEFAHCRGISRENEANFMAFLACINSEDEYLRYSGYLNLYEYLAHALYTSSKDLYFEVLEGLDSRARDDIRASNAVSAAHSDSFLGDIADKANDSYLKANGTEGVVSYGLVVRLAIAYYRES